MFLFTIHLNELLNFTGVQEVSVYTTTKSTSYFVIIP